LNVKWSLGLLSSGLRWGMMAFKVPNPRGLCRLLYYALGPRDGTSRLCWHFAVKKWIDFQSICFNPSVCSLRNKIMWFPWQTPVGGKVRSLAYITRLILGFTVIPFKGRLQTHNYALRTELRCSKVYTRQVLLIERKLS